MRILAHIHTLNDEDVIERSVGAVLGQSHAVDQLLLVDNGSTDATLDRELPPGVEVIRNGENLGTSGAVAIGLQYGLDHGFDWVWTFDADSAPRADALAKLLELYEGLPAETRAETAWLACLPVNAHDGESRHGLEIRPGAYVVAGPAPGCDWYECDVGIWSGTLFRVDAVREIGLPSPHYRLDWGEFEYGYRVRSGGFRSFIHTGAVMDHDIGGAPSSAFETRRFAGIPLPVLNVPPIRAYYYTRNNLYFWLHEYRGPGRLRAALLRLYKCAKLIANAILVPQRRWETLSACARGYWDGVAGNIERRYEPARSLR